MQNLPKRQSLGHSTHQVKESNEEVLYSTTCSAFLRLVGQPQSNWQNLQRKPITRHMKSSSMPTISTQRGPCKTFLAGAK
eukprot:178957-Chlamydomonas_euryale.AAC.1